MRCLALLSLVALVQARGAKRWVSLPSDQLPPGLAASPPLPDSLLPTIAQETERPTPAFTYSAVGFNAPLPTARPLSSWTAPVTLSSVQGVQTSFNVTNWTSGKDASALASGVEGRNGTALVATSMSALSFVAQPLNLTGASNLSFAYSVFVESLGQGGVLPGLVAGADCTGNATSCLSTRLAFDKNGTLSLPSLTASWKSNASLASGRWSRIQQDVSLNSTNAMVALSIDGVPASTWSFARNAKRRRCLSMGGMSAMQHDVSVNSTAVTRVYVAQHQLVVWA